MSLNLLELSLLDLEGRRVSLGDLVRDRALLVFLRHLA
jgi:hypothetical protein